jgi:hypothetical protein
MTAPLRRRLSGVTGLIAVLPEAALLLALYDGLRTRLRTGGGSDRGDTVQWVILTAIGAAIAITVGTIIYTKLTAKANQIDVTTPGSGS